MSAHTSASLPLHGAVPLEARKIWARFAKGRGCAGFCLWPVWPLSRTCTLPVEDLPGCFQRPVCKHSGRLFPQARTLRLSPGEKRFGVVPSQGQGP